MLQSKVLVAVALLAFSYVLPLSAADLQKFTHTSLVDNADTLSLPALRSALARL